MVIVNTVTGIQPIATKRLRHFSMKCAEAKTKSCIVRKLGPRKYSVAVLT